MHAVGNTLTSYRFQLAKSTALSYGTAQQPCRSHTAPLKLQIQGGRPTCMMAMCCRSVKIASVEVAVGDVVVIAAADDEADDDAEPPLALLQAIWQTGKGVMLMHNRRALCAQASAICLHDQLTLTSMCTTLMMLKLDMLWLLWLHGIVFFSWNSGS